MGIPIIKPLTQSHIDEIRNIHEKYFKTEFDFPDFFKHYLGAFIVEDENGIICAGGVRNIPEVILITNKDRNVPDRRSALYQVLDASCFIAGHHGYNGIHAFVQDEKWELMLRKIGFHSTKGNALVLSI